MGKTDKVAYQFLKGENENLRARIAELEASNDALREIANTLKDAAAEDFQRIAELESDLAAMTSRYSRAAADIANLEAEAAINNEHFDDLVRELAEAVLNRAELKDAMLRIVCVLPAEEVTDVDSVVAAIRQMKAQLAEAQKESELHKAFHDLVVKERNLARYQVAKLTAAATIDAAREPAP